jgi:hypothetical protein
MLIRLPAPAADCGEEVLALRPRRRDNPAIWRRAATAEARSRPGGRRERLELLTEFAAAYRRIRPAYQEREAASSVQVSVPEALSVCRFKRRISQADREQSGPAPAFTRSIDRPGARAREMVDIWRSATLRNIRPFWSAQRLAKVRSLAPRGHENRAGFV